MADRARFAGYVFLAATALASAAPALAVPPDFKAKADAYLKSAFPEGGPGAAVIVTDDGKVVYAGGRGLADLETKAPVTPATLFRLGSITKQFAAATLLQLVEEGKVKLDDPLSKYLPDYPSPGADATIAQLLNHTSGVQSYTAVPGWMREEANTARAYSTDEMIALFRDKPAVSKPGETWQYNNSGYVLVGAVIEKVTGKPWHEAVRERMTAPLGLATIRYGVGEETMPGMAKGYTLRDGAPAPARRLHMSVPHAAGGLVGTVEDLARWGAALHHGKAVRPETYSLMVAPTKLPDGTTSPYGFGLGTSTLRDREVVGHSGGIFGYSTDSAYLPKEDIYIAVFANSDEPATSPSLVIQRLGALALGDPFPSFEKVAADVKALEPAFGVFPVQGGERQFYQRDGKLYTRRSGGPEMEVFAAGGERFFYGPQSLTWFALSRDAAGTPVMEMYNNGAKKGERSVRAGAIPPEPAPFPIAAAVLQSYVGRYDTPMGPMEVTLGGNGGLSTQISGQPPVTLRPTSDSEFQARELEAKVVFTSENGAVTGLVIHQGGREMPAKRAE